MPARIIAANFRDMSYVCANLRAEDKAEAEAAVGPFHYIDLAAGHLRDRAYIVEVNGNPEAAFGANRSSGDHLWNAYLFGTKRIARAIPRIRAFCREVMMPDLLAIGAHRVEARALASHFTAHRMLESMGAQKRCDLPGYGVHGETFLLYDWNRDHVLLQPKTAEAEASPADAHDR